jgi:hypothetical protein
LSNIKINISPSFPISMILLVLVDTGPNAYSFRLSMVRGDRKIRDLIFEAPLHSFFAWRFQFILLLFRMQMCKIKKLKHYSSLAT